MATKVKKRKYTKRSTHWNSFDAEIVPTPKQRKLFTKNAPFDNYIKELETMTSHSFTPSEIARLATLKRF